MFLVFVQQSRLQENERDHNESHSAEKSNCSVILLGAEENARWNQLENADVRHDSSREAEQKAEHVLAHELLQHEHAQERAEGLGQAGEEGPQEGPISGVGGVVDGKRDGQSLGDVVRGDSDGERDAHHGVVDVSDEGDNALRDVVQRDRHCRQYAHRLHSRVHVRVDGDGALVLVVLIDQRLVLHPIVGVCCLLRRTVRMR